MSIEAFMNWPPIILVAISSISAAIISNILMFFLCYRKLETMEALLDKCRLVAVHSSYLRNSPRERIARLCAVYCVIALPRFNAWRGVADLEQARAFPRQTKLLLHLTFFLCTLGLSGMVAISFIDPLK